MVRLIALQNYESIDMAKRRSDEAGIIPGVTSMDEDTSDKLGMAAIKKKYGDIVRTGTALFSEKKNKKCLSVSPSYNLGLNGGILEGTWTVISGVEKCGKAQPLDCIVYTPDGKKLMGDLSVGDEVCTPYGDIAKIKNIYEQGIKEVYTVTFNDNSSTRCCKEHLWKVAKNNCKTNYEICSLEEIQKSGLRYSNMNKWKIPMANSVFFHKQYVPLDPYLLGCLIGDGGLTGKTPILTNQDEELISTISNTVSNYSTKLVETGKYGYRITSIDKSLKYNEITHHLKDLGLMGLGSHDKFIPDIYKYNSLDIRLGIIRGLLDTDGNNRQYGVEYSSVSIRLAEDVKEILESFGCKVVLAKRFTSCNGKRFLSYRLSISSNKASELFGLSRKKNKPDRVKPNLYRTIKSIDSCGTEPCRCIELDNTEHLYVTDNFIVTHNSSLTLQIIANGQKEGREAIYVDVESRIKPYNLEGTLGLDQERLKIISPETQEGGANVDIAAEDFLNTVDAMIRMPKYRGCICVIDSLSSLLPKAEMESEVSGTLRANLPKMLSHWIKKNAQAVVRNDIIMILITHYITNTSGYGKQKRADCGVMVQYQADNRIDFTKVEAWEEEGKKIGQKTEAQISCSAMGSSGTTVTSYLRFGLGIDFVKEYIEMGQSYGFIAKGGAWYTMPFLAEYPELAEYAAKKIQGQEKLYEFISENESIRNLLKEEIIKILTF
jgi:RecA/RadA recombinase